MGPYQTPLKPVDDAAADGAVDGASNGTDGAASTGPSNGDEGATDDEAKTNAFDPVTAAECAAADIDISFALASEPQITGDACQFGELGFEFGPHSLLLESFPTAQAGGAAHLTATAHNLTATHNLTPETAHDYTVTTHTSNNLACTTAYDSATIMLPPVDYHAVPSATAWDNRGGDAMMDMS
ncbi:unnamed protein product [Closterium sp. Yama58-4]|nr:unnamed protein product [Closterium sp. Yama58-4]